MKTPMEIINTRDQGAQYLNSDSKVAMCVYPRIHMFPIDLTLISGIMKNGSFGYSLMDMPIEISVQVNESSEDTIEVNGEVRVKNLDLKIDFDLLRSYIGSNEYYDVKISFSSFNREHTGLGMSTQIVGGVYLCCAKTSGRDLKINDLYRIGLGHHSALGLNLLFNPGMIFEVGTVISHKDDGIIANPKVSQEYETIANTVYKVNQFPFYSVAAIPRKTSSVTDEYGDDFFNDTLPTKKEDAYGVVYNIFETIIPSIVESNYEQFISALNETAVLGIKQVEEKFQTERTKKALTQMRHAFDFAGVSSLGPTLYAFSDKNPAERLAQLDIKEYDFVVYDPAGKSKKFVNKGDTILIAGFAAMGKTTYAKQNPHIALDIESIHYERDYINKDSDDEVAKNDKKWTRNPGYPANYIQDVIDGMGKYKVIFLTLAQPVLGELDERGIKYSILYPGPNRKQQILADSKKRGNDDEFVTFLDGLLSTPDHRQEFEGFNHERFEIIDDDMYMEEYLRQRYYL